MITEEQKKTFADRLNDSFNENTKKNEETYKKTSKWLKNVYYKYTHDTLPEEHRLALELRLKKRGITIREFLNTSGNIDFLQILAKSKKTQKKTTTPKVEIKPEEKVTPEVDTKPEEIEAPKVEETQEEIQEIEVETKEELIKLRDKLEEKIHELERTHSKKYRTLNHISDEEYECMCNELSKLKKQRLVINRKLDAIKVKEEKPQKEKETVEKRIEELVIQGKKKDDEINSLKKEISILQSERATIKSKYQEEFAKNYEVYSKQIEEDYNNKLEKEVQKHISKVNQKSEKTLELQKAHILKMLLNNDTVSTDEIKFQLEKHKVSPADLDIAINELRIRIPGITKFYDINKKETVLTINARANDRWNALKENQNSPRISNRFVDKVCFLEHSDLHLDLKSTEDNLKQLFEPTFTYVSTNGNIPIINLGDLVDTLKKIKYDRWKNHDKEAIEQAINFFKNFAKLLATVPEIKYYFLLGNHEKHAYEAGVDLIEIISDYCDNIIPLGANQGSFMLGNDKIGVYHDISDGSEKKARKKVQELSKDCIYSLIAHYHMGAHMPLQGCSLVNNGINWPILFQANLKDGNVEYLNAIHILPKNNQLIELYQTETELYNSDYQYVKRSQ